MAWKLYVKKMNGLYRHKTCWCPSWKKPSKILWFRSSKEPLHGIWVWVHSLTSQLTLLTQKGFHHHERCDNWWVWSPHPTPRRFLNRVRPTGSNSRRIARRWLFVYLFEFEAYEIVRCEVDIASRRLGYEKYYIPFARGTMKWKVQPLLWAVSWA